ncbi:MAG: NAD-dependent epimerase/dehydratase family protein [Pirellulales bacterium]
MAHALITGATGFIGPHLAERLLQRGDRVTCLVRKSSNVERLKELGVEFAQSDVTDPALATALPSVDVVYHLAGLVKALRPAELLRVNEGGTRNLAAALAAQTQPPVLVVVSSLAAAGTAPDGPAGRARVEVDPPSPVSHYGRSKRAAEVAAAEFADRLPITIVRPPIVFGEGDREVLQMIQPIARFGLHMVPGYTTRRFSLVHAGDLAHGLIQAAERGTRLSSRGKESETGGIQDLGQGVYFIAAAEQPTYAELGQIIATALGKRWYRAVRSPEFVSWMAGGGAQLVSKVRGKPGILNLDKVTEAVAGSWICDIGKARQELDYQPSAPVQQQMDQTVAWYRERKWL